MQLYKLDEAIDRLWYEVELSGGEITPEQEAQLEELSKSWEDKMRNACIALKRLKASHKAMKEEKVTLEKQLHSTAHHIEWLEGYVGRSLGHDRQFKDFSGAHRLWWKDSERVEPLDAEKLTGVPEQFIDRKEVISLRKDEIKHWLKEHEGEKVEGVRIDVHWNLQVK